jgi:hypothetical protein
VEGEVAEVVERDSGSGHRVSSGGQCFFLYLGVERAGAAKEIVVWWAKIFRKVERARLKNCNVRFPATNKFGMF